MTSAILVAHVCGSLPARLGRLAVTLCDGHKLSLR
jgi:hypothetical protein